MSQLPEFWCSRRLLVTVEGPQGKSVIPLARPLARIGRERGSDIVLDSPWVARRSLYLHATDEGVFCFYFQPEEKESQRLGFWLAPGEPLLVGPYRISACLEGDEPGPAPALVPLDEWGSAPPPCPVFQVYSQGKLCHKRRFRARLNLIGRRHECALQIKGQQVSAFHGCLYWQYPRLWYIDLVSSNGTSLNSQRVECAEVRRGDRLEVGEFTLVFQRLSERGTASSEPRIRLPAGDAPAEMLPPDFDDDLPLEQDGPVSIELAGAEAGEVADSAPVMPPAAASEPPTRDTLAAAGPVAQAPPAQDAIALPAAESDSALAAAAAGTMAAQADETALASVQRTRQELALLQHRVQELTQLTAQAGKSAVQQLALQTREAFERERQRIAQELARRANELAQEKLALEERWQAASRELATQVSQLRDEATLLARQRQAMEQSRLAWDAQRGQLEQHLRAYAQQLARLEQSTPAAWPAPLAPAASPAATLPPDVNGSLLSGANGTAPSPAARPFALLGLEPTASIEENKAATALVLAAAGHPGVLAPRSHVVDAQVAGQRPDAFTRQPELPGLGFSAAAAPLAASVLEGKLAAQGETAAAPQAAAAGPRPLMRRRKTSKDKEVFDLVTNRLVEMEQGRRQKLILLGIAGGVAVVALAALMIVAAVMLR